MPDAIINQMEFRWIQIQNGQVKHSNNHEFDYLLAIVMYILIQKLERLFSIKNEWEEDCIRTIKQLHNCVVKMGRWKKAHSKIIDWF